ncbi:hypothetical protein ACQUQU_13490 [Thalassolituus sp. LLYu03]|uniref:hypothetical protein n=1 Tax=Thalassolituus sp. LLYu03 TaxID=3421656 RepID=UPI003D2C9C9A
MSADYSRLQRIAAALAAHSDFDAQVSALKAVGIDEAEAEHWADLMPVAFARAAYRFQYQGPYPLDKQRDLQGRPPFSDDPLFQQALLWACDCGAMDSISSAEFNGIVRLSPEFEVIRERLNS